MTESIIVYRSPVEKLFWDGFTSEGGYIMLICMVAGILAVILAAFSYSLIERHLTRKYWKLAKRLVNLDIMLFVGLFVYFAFNWINGL